MARVGGRVIPIVVRAHLSGAVMMPEHPVHLDSLLMAAVALRDNLPPLGFGQRAEIDIPLAQDRGLYLTSQGLCAIEAYEKRHITRRFPMAEAQMFGDGKLRRVNMKAGPCKGYRFPIESTLLKQDLVTWYAVGLPAEVETLLGWVTHLAKKRSVGLGRVARWEVGSVMPWEGFPMLRDGRPLRALPLDWPGLGEHRIERRVLSPPYWERWREQECAVA